MLAAWWEVKKLLGIQQQPVILGYQPLRAGQGPVFPRKRPPTLQGPSASDWQWCGRVALSHQCRRRTGPLRASDSFASSQVHVPRLRRGAPLQSRGKSGWRQSSMHRISRFRPLARLLGWLLLFVVSLLLLWVGVPSGSSLALGSFHRLRFPSHLVCPVVRDSDEHATGSGGRAGTEGVAPGSLQRQPGGAGQVTKAVIFSTYPPTKCGLATFAMQLRQGLLQVRRSSPCCCAVLTNNSRRSFPTAVGALTARLRTVGSVCQAGVHKVDVVAVVAESEEAQQFPAEVGNCSTSAVLFRFLVWPLAVPPPGVLRLSVLSTDRIAVFSSVAASSTSHAL